jgi:carbonic anhydrase
MENNIIIKEARHAEDYSAAKELILEYVTWLGIDLSFQNFDQEMNTLPTTYGNKDGRLFIAFIHDQAVGIAGIKRFNDSACEVKRMYVKPASRGLGIGKRLLMACIDMAKKLNYESIKLDSAAYMKSAIKIYTECGFVEIPAYRYNPHEDAKYFELVLSGR